MKIGNLRIGARLALSFGVVIALSIGSTSVALMQAKKNVEATRAMLDKPLAKERLLGEWLRATTVSVERAKVIAKSTDGTLAEAFSRETAEATTLVSGLSAQVEKVLDSADERAVYEKAITRRVAYRSARDEVAGFKKTGDEESAQKKFSQDMLPAAAGYLESVKELVALERQMISTTTERLESESSASFWFSCALSSVVVLMSALGAAIVSKSITKPLGEAVAIASRVARGDLAASFGKPAGDEVGAVMAALAAMSQSLRAMVQEIQGGASAIGGASAQIAAGNLDLSGRTESQAASLEEAASSMEELTAAVSQNAEHAAEANGLAQEASKVAAKGGEMAGKVASSMNAIDASSKKIGDILSVIDSIAFQTNILALNAAVEAARAGDQGRGFAVVATEVRALAHRSAAAAKEIKALIEESAVQVGQGSRLAKEAEATMAKAVESSLSVTRIMEEIAAASKEQSSGIAQVSQSVAHMDEATQQNSALVEESAAAAESLREQAEILERLASRFII